MDYSGIPDASKIWQWLEINGWTRQLSEVFQAPQVRRYSSKLGLSVLLVHVPSGDHRIDRARRALALEIIAEAHGLDADGLADFIREADFTVELAHLEMDRQLTEPRGNAQYRARVEYQELALPEKKPLPREGLRLEDRA